MTRYSGPDAVVGDIVIWHAHGDRSSEGAPAMVMKRHGNGCLRLDLYHSRLEISSVRHIDDPALIENPDAKANFGGWDYRENDPRGGGLASVTHLVISGDRAAEIAKELVEQPSSPDLRATVYGLADDRGLSATEIAAELDVPHQKITAILRSRKAALAQ